MKFGIIFISLIISTVFSFGQVKSNITIGNSKPIVLGSGQELQSKILGEKRTLNIYLPEGYDPNDTLKYPVVYLLDGSVDEDFIHIVGLFQFNSFSWINRVPKSIIVGIATVDRRRDFTFPSTIAKEKKSFPTTGHSDKFMSFIESELQPFIEKNYKTSHSKMIIGESLGGLFATEVLLKKPKLFNQYIIVSPSLWWDNGSLLKEAWKFSEDKNIYIGVGKEGLTPTDNPRVMEVDANSLADKLKEYKYKNCTIYFDYLPQENHATIMHQSVFNALRIIYPEVLPTP